MDIYVIADKISFEAYQMYSGKPSEHAEEPFPMYSYDRISSLFWRGVAIRCLEEGLSEDQTKDLMRSKNMRWRFDGSEDDVIDFGKSFLDGFNFEEFKGV